MRGGIEEKIRISSVPDTVENAVTIDAKALDSIDSAVDPAAEKKADMDKRLQDKSMTREEYDGYFESLEQYGTKEP